MDETPCAVYSAAQRLRAGSRDDVREALVAARERTLALARASASALPPGLGVPRRATLNPPLWELGHVAWFQEFWIARNRRRALGVEAGSSPEREPSLLPGADALYDSSAVAHDRRWELPLPDWRGTLEFLERTAARTLELLDALPQAAGDDALYFFRLAAAHEEMHAEAAIYMARALGIAVPPGVLAAAPAAAPAAGDLKVPARSWRLGWSGPGFAFDNELRAHEVALAAFRIDAGPVTWARFLEFAQDGGYRDPRWWDEAGAAWLRGAGAREAQLAADAGAPGAAAVHLSAHEARAWCRWAERRLPTEAEWECAALTLPGFAWGEVWEWTASAFEPYPGFEPHPYRDYSRPWFGTRVVLRGACRATSPRLAYPRYRNFFEPHRTDVFAGFRSCAR